MSLLLWLQKFLFLESQLVLLGRKMKGILTTIWKIDFIYIVKIVWLFNLVFTSVTQKKYLQRIIE